MFVIQKSEIGFRLQCHSLFPSAEDVQDFLRQMSSDDREVQFLSLQNVLLQQDVDVLMKAVFARYRNLQVFNLRQTQLPASTLMVLVEGLRQNTQQKVVIDISHNQLSENALDDFFNTLNTTVNKLVVVDITGNVFDEKQVEAWKKLSKLTILTQRPQPVVQEKKELPVSVEKQISSIPDEPALKKSPSRSDDAVGNDKYFETLNRDVQAYKSLPVNQSASFFGGFLKRPNIEEEATNRIIAGFRKVFSAAFNSNDTPLFVKCIDIMPDELKILNLIGLRDTKELLHVYNDVISLFAKGDVKPVQLQKITRAVMLCVARIWMPDSKLSDADLIKEVEKNQNFKMLFENLLRRATEAADQILIKSQPVPPTAPFPGNKPKPFNINKEDINKKLKPVAPIKEKPPAGSGSLHEQLMKQIHKGVPLNPVKKNVDSFKPRNVMHNPGCALSLLDELKNKLRQIEESQNPDNQPNEEWDDAATLNRKSLH